MAKMKRGHGRGVRFTKGAGATGVPQSMGNFDGANRSMRRGNIWWSTLDTREELDSFSRAELLRRCRWLRTNVGFYKGFIKNGAMLVGWMTPQARTADEEWNKAADLNFRNRAMAKTVFDVGGKFNFKTAQRMLMQKVLCDGDILTVLTESGNKGAAVAFYESHQFRNPKGAKREHWRDGVRMNPATGRHIAYGLGDGKKVKVIGARDACYFGVFESPGNGRAHPPLAHGVTHAVDVTEVRADTKHGIKNAALLGIVSELESGNQRTRSRGGMEVTAPMGIYGEEVVPGEWEGGVRKVKTEQVWSGGQVVSGVAGEKFKILTDGRPHPNQMEFIRELIHDIAHGYGLPPEAVGHMGKLTAPGLRFVLEVAKRWIEEWQLELVSWCHRYWVYHMAKEIKAGRLEMPDDENWMLGVEWTPRRSLTIDRGHDGKQRLDEIEGGHGTWADWFADVDGSDWRVKVRQRVNEVAYARDVCDEMGVEYAEVFRPRQGAAAPATGEKKREEDDGDDDDE